MTVRPLISLTLLCALFCCAPSPARGQGADELRRLLALPAPTPRAGAPAQGQAEEKSPRPESFYSPGKRPPDDAPLEDLLDYWQRWAFASGRRARPSDGVRQRLLEACEAEPGKLAHLAAYLPETAEAAERVKKMYDAEQSFPQFDEYWAKTVRGWLKLNSKYFLDELLALARKARDKGSYVENGEALGALARVAPEAAAPLLHSLAAGGQPLASVTALAILYRSARRAGDAAAEESYRARLRAVAADRGATAGARDTAVETLSLTEWPGRDEWYLSLFEDETLFELGDGNLSYSPLASLPAREPEKWIPVMARLVEGKNQTVRDAAASCLVIFYNRDAREDALRPLLPWLSDPNWAKDDGDDRLRLIQSMSFISIPESVPGLIRVVEHDEYESHRSYAAQALAKYKDPRAAPALRKALAEPMDEDDRQRIIQGLVACGMPEAEQLSALEAYAEKLTTAGGREGVGKYRFGSSDPLPLPVSVGEYVARREDVPDSLAAAVLDRAEGLRVKNPALARALYEVAEGWQTRRVESDVLRRIAEGWADADTIARTLLRRDRLQKDFGAELRLLAGAGGAAQGVAVALLGDEVLAQNVLGSKDRLAQTALLASARLVQMPLPAAQVGALLGGREELTALAAERYLLAEDSEEARALLWGRHRDEAFITGWRENGAHVGGQIFEAMGKAEEKLRAEMLKDGGPVEIFALLGSSERPASVLRVYADRAVYTDYEDGARHRERVVSAEELGRFRGFVAAGGLEEVGPQFGPCHHDCLVSEFLSLTRPRGRRVFSLQGMGAWRTLFAAFDDLGRGPGVKIHYGLEEQIEGLEVLHAEESLKAVDVWQRGADTRVLFERERTKEESEQQQKDDEAVYDEEDEEAREAAREEARRRSAERDRARFSWRAFAAGRPGAVAPRPEGYSAFGGEDFEVDGDTSPSLNGNKARAVAGDTVIAAGSFLAGGLWKESAGRAPVRVGGEGKYADPVVTPDGKWAVAAKAETDWAKPNHVVRVNLQTGAEFRVEVPAADEFGAVAYLEAHGLVLLRRARDEAGYSGKPAGPDAPEYYLLDAATGRTQPVAGVFEPLRQEGKRFLQPAGGAAEYWAAVPDRAKNQTRVGRYNLKDFSFRPLLVVPQLLFDSMAMLVGDGATKLYVVYEGQLLRLPMKSSGQ